MPLGDAIGSVLARDATAPAGLPRFDNAAMDGFAVRSADLTAGGTGSDLKVTAIIAAGEIGFHEIGPGQAARIMTGAMIPKGADRVVVQENARMNGDRVRVFTSASDKPHIRRTGTDQLLAALVGAAGDHDLIVTSGGASAGFADHCPILILPGNPLAAVAGCAVLGRTLVYRLAGCKIVESDRLRLPISRSFSKPLGRTQILPGRLVIDPVRSMTIADPLPERGSASLQSISNPTVLIVLNSNRGDVQQGDIVDVVQLWDV